MPSIYFIDSTTGVDLEVTGGEVTKDKLVESIDKAATKMQVQLGSESWTNAVIESRLGKLFDPQKDIIEALFRNGEDI